MINYYYLIMFHYIQYVISYYYYYYYFLSVYMNAQMSYFQKYVVSLFHSFKTQYFWTF